MTLASTSGFASISPTSITGRCGSISISSRAPFRPSCSEPARDDARPEIAMKLDRAADDSHALEWPPNPQDVDVWDLEHQRPVALSRAAYPSATTREIAA